MPNVYPAGLPKGPAEAYDPETCPSFPLPRKQRSRDGAKKTTGDRYGGSHSQHSRGAGHLLATALQASPELVHPATLSVPPAALISPTAQMIEITLISNGIFRASNSSSYLVSP